MQRILFQSSCSKAEQLYAENVTCICRYRCRRSSLHLVLLELKQLDWSCAAIAPDHYATNMCVSCLFSIEVLNIQLKKELSLAAESCIDQQCLTLLMISYAWQAVLAILTCFRIATQQQYLSQTHICLQVAKHTSSKILHTYANCVEGVCQTYVFQKLAP